MSKGGAFEREMCSKMSLWYTDGERDDIFYRTGGSGGRATMRRKVGKTTEGQAGDLTYTDPIGKPLVDRWNIEFKTGYSSRSKTKKGERVTNWGPLDILDSRQNKSMLVKLWEECVVDAEATNRDPILIFRRPGRKPCICFTQEVRNRLIPFFGSPPFPILKVDSRRADYYKENPLNLMPVDNFFSWAIFPKVFFENTKGG